MSAVNWAVARTRGHCNGWTIEAFRGSSGGWWIEIYSAWNGKKIENLFKVYPTIKRAHREGNKIARKHVAPAFGVPSP